LGLICLIQLGFFRSLLACYSALGARGKKCTQAAETDTRSATNWMEEVRKKLIRLNLGAFLLDSCREGESDPY
jgi:hypothetical protein